MSRGTLKGADRPKCGEVLPYLNYLKRVKPDDTNIDAEMETSSWGSRVTGTQLWFAARERQPEEVERLAKLGANLNAVGWFGGAGATPLMVAIQTAYGGGPGSALPTCRKLVALGADVNARVLGDETALYWAFFQVRGHPETDVVKFWRLFT